MAAPASRTFAPSSSIPATSVAANVEIFKVEEDEYEAKESEQPRAMEFHTSSSSESESEGEEEGSPSMNGRSATASMMFSERPKTAVKELEQYRDAVPEEFFQRIEQEEDSDYELERHTDSTNTVGTSASDPLSTQQQQRQAQRMTTEAMLNSQADPKECARPKDQAALFRVHVPAEVQELFSVRCCICCRSCHARTHRWRVLTHYLSLLKRLRRKRSTSPPGWSHSCLISCLQSDFRTTASRYLPLHCTTTSRRYLQ